jgi:hypothetical protein
LNPTARSAFCVLPFQWRSGGKRACPMSLAALRGAGTQAAGWNGSTLLVEQPPNVRRSGHQLELAADFLAKLLGIEDDAKTSRVDGRQAREVQRDPPDPVLRDAHEQWLNLAGMPYVEFPS